MGIAVMRSRVIFAYCYFVPKARATHICLFVRFQIRCCDVPRGRLGLTGVESSVERIGLRAVTSPEQILQNKNRVGRTLCQAAHEVGIPLRSEGNVHAAAPAFLDQALLKVAADAVQHLKLKCRRRNFFFLRELNRRANHAFVMRGHAMIDAALEQHLHQLDVAGVDV